MILIGTKELGQGAEQVAILSPLPDSHEPMGMPVSVLTSPYLELQTKSQEAKVPPLQPFLNPKHAL